MVVLPQDALKSGDTLFEDIHKTVVATLGSLPTTLSTTTSSTTDAVEMTVKC